MKQCELLKFGIELLNENNVTEVEVKAKMLLGFVLKQSREELVKNSMEEVAQLQKQEYINGLEQIAKGKPLQYITHNQNFMGLDFYVDENVLIPQPDTELLVEQIISLINNSGNIYANEDNSIYKEITLLDLCTGSGAIAVSIAKYAQNEETRKNIQISHSERNELEALVDNGKLSEQNKQIDNSKLKLKIVASDISSKAIEIAGKNAIKNEVEEKIELIQSDMFSNLVNYRFDIIVSNPPYIETEIIQTLDKEVQHEPTLALDGGEDGLKFYNIILQNAEKYLKPNGYVLLEIGYDQGEKIFGLLEKLKVEDKCNLKAATKEPIKDLSGNDRLVILTYTQ